jgi:hypothetical protein
MCTDPNAGSPTVTIECIRPEFWGITLHAARFSRWIPLDVWVYSTLSRTHSATISLASFDVVVFLLDCISVQETLEDRVDSDHKVGGCPFLATVLFTFNPMYPVTRGILIPAVRHLIQCVVNSQSSWGACGPCP